MGTGLHAVQTTGGADEIVLNIVNASLGKQKQEDVWHLKKILYFCSVMKEKILQEAKQHAEEARKQGRTHVKVTLKSGETSSLGKMIRTKEQADSFMKMLKAL